MMYLTQVIVIFNWLINPKIRGTSIDLLFWRSVCDMGLAIRFFWSEFHEESLCASKHCSYSGHLKIFIVIVHHIYIYVNICSVEVLATSYDNTPMYDPVTNTTYPKCSEYGCDINVLESRICEMPSTLFEFFEIASEAWFFCLAIDLYFSLSNPFLLFKQRCFNGYRFM